VETLGHSGGTSPDADPLDPQNGSTYTRCLDRAWAPGREKSYSATRGSRSMSDSMESDTEIRYGTGLALAG
jgi:hypothetical protein